MSTVDMNNDEQVSEAQTKLLNAAVLNLKGAIALSQISSLFAIDVNVDIALKHLQKALDNH